MLSGGKDSTAALYLMKRRYRMSPLAFTFDAPVVICHLCSIWYMRLTLETARAYGTRLIIAGWTTANPTIYRADQTC